MGSKAKAPKAPDYAALARQQAQLDRDQDIWRMQNSGQKDMYGSAGFVLGPDGKYQNVSTMSPELEALHKGGMGLFGDMQQKVADQGDFVGPDQIQWDPSSGKAASDAMFASYMSRAGKDQGDAQARMQTQLRQQGLQPGTAAYDRAYQNLLVSQGDVNTKANLDSIVLGGNEARQNYASQLAGQNQNFGQDLQKYQIPWQQMADAQGSWNSLRSGPQGYAPSWTGQAADMMGASDKTYNAKMGAANASNAKKGQTTSAAASLGSAAMM